MSLRRIGLLLHREFVRGPKNFMFIFAVIVPLVLSLTMLLVFGTLFAEKPRLGIADAGDSQFTHSAAATEAFTVRKYASEAELRDATAMGAVDIGVVLPSDFDESVSSGKTTTVTAYIWGGSLLKDRAALAATTATWVRQMAGQVSPVNIITTVLDGSVVLPWEDRLLPLILMMGVTFGGLMIPASSLVAEKQQHTLAALSVTPATMVDIYAAKGLVGVTISTVMTLVILGLNRTLGNSTLLLAGVLLLSAIFAAEAGVVIGTLVKDIDSLFATVKALGLLLYAPALIYVFPDIPQWIARVFPTYYIIHPVIEITQHGARLADIAGKLGVLLILILALGGLLALLTQRMRYRH